VIVVPDDGIPPYGCVLSSRASEMLGVSREAVRLWIHAGKLDAIKQGHHYWVRIEDVHELAAAPKKRGGRCRKVAP